MSSTKDTGNKDTSSTSLTAQQQADISFNRLNVALARSNRIIQSWLPPRDDTQRGESREDNDEHSEDDETFFKTMTEDGGLASKKPYATDDALNNGVLSGRKSGGDDRLLEQLIGKKAAAAKRKEKERENQQKMAAAKSKTSGPSINGTASKGRNEVDNDSEPEEGRAARFSSKKSLGKKQPAKIEMKTPSEPSDDERPRKRKANSYLDELLASKKKKKKSRG